MWLGYLFTHPDLVGTVIALFTLYRPLVQISNQPSDVVILDHISILNLDYVAMGHNKRDM